MFKLPSVNRKPHLLLPGVVEVLTAVLVVRVVVEVPITVLVAGEAAVV